jgi:iron donor protein CyaY
MNFYNLCENFLQNLAEKLELQDVESKLEVEYQDGILEIIIINNKKTFIINRNAGNQKIWYSSPFLGADYFSFDESSQHWLNADGKELSEKLFNELNIILKQKNL